MNNIQLFNGTADDVKQLKEKINKFSAAKLSFTGEIEIEKIYVMKDEVGNFVGGIIGYFYLEECLYIHILFIAEDKRYQGLGSALLKKIEDEAIAMKIKIIHLDTFDFQAKDFYLQHGYTVFGVLDDCPQGHKRYSMKKKL